MRIIAKHETSVFLIWKLGHCDHSQTHQKVLTGQLYVNHHFFGKVKMHFHNILIDIHPHLREVFSDYFIMMIMVLILRLAQFLLLYSERVVQSQTP